MFSIQPSTEIWCRDDFPYLCMWRKLFRAAEIGVDRGEWAALFLSRWIGHEWWGIDDYQPCPEFSYPREVDRQMAIQKLHPHSSRARLLQLPSTEAARLFAPGSLDFVYIDGAHDYQSVVTDLRAWYSTLSDNGILAGHDWTDQPNHSGVKPAVKEFASEIGQTIYLTSVNGYGQEICPSWYLYKHGMPGGDWKRC